jgi:hypothetical protein
MRYAMLLSFAFVFCFMAMIGMGMVSYLPATYHIIGTLYPIHTRLQHTHIIKIRETHIVVVWPSGQSLSDNFCSLSSAVGP